MFSAITDLPLSKFVVIEDTNRLYGQNLFFSLIKDHIGKHPVHVICFEKHPLYYKDNLQNINNVTFSDCFSNDSNFYNTVLQTVRNLAKLNEDVIVVIDSFSEFVILIDDAYRTLRNLLNNKCILQIMTLLHTDCLISNKTLINLNHIATAVITLNSKAKKSIQECSFLLRRPGRKVVKENVSYWFDENKKLQIKTNLSLKKTASDVKENLPADLSTFRIELNDLEKKSRDEVVLPYTNSTSGGGKVIYELEVADDWDEEDPDDDLDV